MSDAISVLKEQHVEVSALLMKLERISDPVLRASVFRTIDTNLRIHAKIEEEIFYPEFKKRAKSRSQVSEVDENYDEHAEVKRTLEEIERIDPASGDFMRAVLTLKRLVQHHVNDEEHRMFKEAQRLFTSRDLSEVGFVMEAAARSVSPAYEMAGPRM